MFVHQMDPAQFIEPSLGVPAGTPATSLPGSVSTPQQITSDVQGKGIENVLSKCISNSCSNFLTKSWRNNGLNDAKKIKTDFQPS